MEKSFYNAYLGSLNTEHHESRYVHNKFSDVEVVPCFLPFDSYSPLTPGKRGQKVGGNQLLPDNSYYGCCACIGAAGIGLVPKLALLTTEGGFSYNLFIDGKIKPISLELIDQTVEGKYPSDHYGLFVKLDI